MILSYNKQIIQKTLGKQGSSQCGVYSIAYGWSILENRCRVSGSPASHKKVAEKYNPSSFDICYWSEDGLVSHKANSIKDRYSAIISQLKSGKPVVVAVKGASYNHYVLVIGVKDGKTSSNVKPTDFYIIDPADAKIGYYGTTWASKSGFNGSDYGLQYCTFNTNKKAGFVSSSKTTSVRTNAEIISGVLKFARDYANDNRYAYKVYNNGNGRLCPLCHPGSGNGWNCIGFVTACFYHGGGLTDRITCSNDGFLYDGWANNNLTINTWNDRNGPGWIEVTKGYREQNISTSRLKAGDVFVGFNSSSGNSYQHTFLYIGNDQVADSTGGSDDSAIAIRNYSGRYTGFWSRVFRFTANATGTSYAGSGVDDGQGLDMRQAISKLYSSDNFKYVKVEEKEESKSSKFTSEIQKYLNNIKFTPDSVDSEAIPEPIVNSALASAKFEANKPEKVLTGRSTQLLSYPTWVEAPTIILDFNGIKIGGYGNRGDVYPNYITSMSVNKINGQINQYTFNLTYQVRPNEDPNFIDRLISRTGYLKPLKVLYGDSNYPNSYYREESAVIIDVKHSEDVSSYRINYTISAISSVGASQASLTTFKEKTDKPSNIIYNLLYNSGSISNSLLDIFPGMRDRTLVFSKGLIPNTDSVVTVGGMSNTSPLNYLSHLVSCMNNVNNNSTYFLSLVDNSYDGLNGAYFRIDEVTSYNNSQSKNIKISNNYFELDIGFPTENYVTSFQLCNNNYWPLVYKYAGSIPKYEYDIDNDGNVIQTKTNTLFSNNRYMETSLVDSNWWKQVTEFPISAKVIIKGLLNPAMLMSYIKINTLFYGQKDIASGLYVVTAQNDIISGSGYSTELTLLRVAGDI